MDYDYLAQCLRQIWESAYEMAEVLCHTFRRVFAFFKKREQASQIRRRLWRRSENQRPHALFLDRRRKTYHCRNACATDYW